MDWREQAECRDKDPAIFFPYDQGSGVAVDFTRGKAICARCEVRCECLEWAVANVPYGETGLYGGLDPNERRNLKRDQLQERRTARGDLPSCAAPYCREPSRGWSSFCSDGCMRAQRAAMEQVGS